MLISKILISKMLLRCHREAAKPQLTFERAEATPDKDRINRKGRVSGRDRKGLKWNNVLQQGKRGVWKCSYTELEAMMKLLFLEPH